MKSYITVPVVQSYILGLGLMDYFCNLYLCRGHTLLAKPQEGGSGCAISSYTAVYVRLFEDLSGVSSCIPLSGASCSGIAGSLSSKHVMTSVDSLTKVTWVLRYW